MSRAFLWLNITAMSGRIVPYDPAKHQDITRLHARLVGNDGLQSCSAYRLSGQPAYYILRGNKIEWIYGPGYGHRLLRSIRSKLQGTITASVSIDRRETVPTVLKRINFWIAAGFRARSLNFHANGVSVGMDYRAR